MDAGFNLMKTYIISVQYMKKNEYGWVKKFIVIMATYYLYANLINFLIWLLFSNIR